jgi:hypothetical protein
LSTGGDRYGTELLQTDVVVQSATELNTIIAGEYSSEVKIVPISETDTAGTSVPPPHTFAIPSGVFHTQPSRYKAVYVAAGSPFDGKPVPGNFSGLGTSTVKFTYSNLTVTNSQNSYVTGYKITVEYINYGNPSLSRVPSEPKLVKNYRTSGGTFFYQGVLDSEDYRVIETWASTEVPGYQNYTLAYTVKDATDLDQRYMASSVEIHYFMKVSSSNYVPVGSHWVLQVPSIIRPDSADVAYTIFSIRRIKNITSGFSPKTPNCSSRRAAGRQHSAWRAARRRA